MTEEKETAQSNLDDPNGAWRDDDPSYSQGDARDVTAHFYAVAAPRHGYAQYKAAYNGTDVTGRTSGSSIMNANTSMGSPNVFGTVQTFSERADGSAIGSIGAAECPIYYSFSNTDITLAGLAGDTVKQQMASHNYANVRFHTHPQNNITVSTAFIDKLPTNPGKVAETDGNRIQATVGGISNTTAHTADMTVTVSLMQDVAGATGAVTGYKKMFELTSAPHIAATDTLLVDGGYAGLPKSNLKNMFPAAGAAVGDDSAAIGADKMPYDASGRPRIKVEYFVPQTKLSLLGGSGAGMGANPANGAANNGQGVQDQITNDYLDYRPTVGGTVSGSQPSGSASSSTVEGMRGNWYSEEELAKIFNASSQEATDEGHTANSNKFRDVTAVRWTYYDVPGYSTYNGSGIGTAVGYALPNVVLDGVARYQDIRLDNTGAAISTGTEQANKWTGTMKTDLAFTHFHNENTVLSFIGSTGTRPDPAAITYANDLLNKPADLDHVSSALATADNAVTHGTLLTKQDENKDTTRVVYRRTPIMRFQNQAFQTEAQVNEASGSKYLPWKTVGSTAANSTYYPDAEQKTSYVPGETFWYKDTLVNVPMGTNSGMTELEGELYNPVIYERIPVDYLKQAAVEAGVAGEEIDADYMAKLLESRIKWTNRDDEDVYASRTRGMKLQVTAIDEGQQKDVGGNMVYRQDSGAPYRYFSDMDPRNSSYSTHFVTFKIEWVVDGEVKDDIGSEVSGVDQASRPVDQIQPGSTRMEVGDVIELWFPVQAAIDGLPQVYMGRGVTGVNDLLTSSSYTGLEPSYFPRIGEYYYYPYVNNNGASGRINPLNTGSNSSDSGDGYFGIGAFRDWWGAVRVANENIAMDMNYLMHEAAFSGDKAEQTDLWEMFDGSLVYIPGLETNYYVRGGSGDWDVNNWGVNGGGNNSNGASGGVFLDEDVKVTRNKQIVRYSRWPRRHHGGGRHRRGPRHHHGYRPRRSAHHPALRELVLRQWQRQCGQLR